MLVNAHRLIYWLIGVFFLDYGLLVRTFRRVSDGYLKQLFTLVRMMGEWEIFAFYHIKARQNSKFVLIALLFQQNNSLGVLNRHFPSGWNCFPWQFHPIIIIYCLHQLKDRIRSGLGDNKNWMISIPLIKIKIWMIKSVVLWFHLYFDITCHQPI